MELKRYDVTMDVHVYKVVVYRRLLRNELRILVYLFSWIHREVITLK